MYSEPNRQLTGTSFQPRTTKMTLVCHHRRKALFVSPNLEYSPMRCFHSQRHIIARSVAGFGKSRNRLWGDRAHGKACGSRTRDID